MISAACSCREQKVSVDGLIIVVSSRLLRTMIASRISFVIACTREGRIAFLLFFFTEERKPLFTHVRERVCVCLVFCVFFYRVFGYIHNFKKNYLKMKKRIKQLDSIRLRSNKNEK